MDHDHLSWTRLRPRISSHRLRRSSYWRRLHPRSSNRQSPRISSHRLRRSSYWRRLHPGSSNRRSGFSRSHSSRGSGIDDNTSKYLLSTCDNITPGVILTGQRKALIKKVKNLIKSRYIIAKVRTYGSWKSHLSVLSSDVDFSVNLPSDFDCPEHTSHQIAKALQDLDEHRTGIFDVKVRCFRGRHCIFGTDRESNTNIDLTINNKLAPMGSIFMRSIVDIDSMIKTFLILVKYFSKIQNLDNPGNGRLASIGFLYMALFFLQKKNLVPKFISRSSIRDMDQLGEVIGEIENFNVKCDSNIGKLLMDFFHYYSQVHNFDEYAISVLGGRLVRKSSIGWDDGMHLSIIDPFSSDNIGKSVRLNGLNIIKCAFQRAHGILLEGSKPQDLFQSFNICN